MKCKENVRRVGEGGVELKGTGGKNNKLFQTPNETLTLIERNIFFFR